MRYKSASGWPAFHPHISEQSPLDVEVVDRANQVLASGFYYCWNPDGPRYEGRPENLGEARKRQKNRWRPSNARLGMIRTPREPVYTEESNYTLDLRLQTRDPLTGIGIDEADQI